MSWRRPREGAKPELSGTGSHQPAFVDPHLRAISNPPSAVSQKVLNFIADSRLPTADSCPYPSSPWLLYPSDHWPRVMAIPMGVPGGGLVSKRVS